MGIASVWSQLQKPHRRWIVVNALIATAAINVVVNAAIAWLSVQGQETVPLWGTPLLEASAFWNVVGTLFLLPLITCLMVTTLVRRDVRLGSLASLSRLRFVYGWLAALPPTRLRRGVACGAIAVASLAPPLLLVLVLCGSPELTRGQFIAYQVIFATALGVVVTPTIALYAMADPDDEPRVDPGP